MNENTNTRVVHSRFPLLAVFLIIIYLQLPSLISDCGPFKFVSSCHLCYVMLQFSCCKKLSLFFYPVSVLMLLFFIFWKREEEKITHFWFCQLIFASLKNRTILPYLNVTLCIFHLKSERHSSLKN